MRDRGGTLTCVEHSAARRRREDLSVREWIATRFRDDVQDAIWHLEAFDELAAYLDAHGLRAAVPELDLQLGAPASDEDIDALDAERAHPVPTSLRLLWRAHGRASWKLGTDGRRLLGPREVLARRAATRADVIVESLAGEPVTFLGDFPRDDGHVFGHVVDSGEPHWDASLAWSIATRLVGDLEVALVAAAPILGDLRYGQRTERQERGVYLEKDGAFWDAVVDLDAGVATVRVGPIDHVGETLIERIEPGTAEAWLDAQAAQRWALGYRNPPPAKPRTSGRTPATKPAKAPRPTAKAKARKGSPKAPPKAAKAKATKPSPRAIKKSPPKRAVRSKRTSK
ncbi:MAG: hypothetical protein NT062_00745 [Proteobacteria bacterium]|nr:hypothetical protein [Pseudomonadota bacterium]